MSDILEVMLADESFSVVFQPIFDIAEVADGAVGDGGADARPAGTHFESASVLFEYVRLKRDEVRVDRHCCAIAVAAVGRLGMRHPVTVNAHASTLERDSAFPELILSSCRDAGVRPTDW